MTDLTGDPGRGRRKVVVIAPCCTREPAWTIAKGCRNAVGSFHGAARRSGSMRARSVRTRPSRGGPMIEFAGFTDQQLEQFRRYQAVSFAVLDEVVAQLKPGVSERDATRWAMKAYRREGADRFFHLPVALFGERSALPEPWTTESFWPTTRTLEPGDSVVLDASPIFNGYVV